MLPFRPGVGWQTLLLLCALAYCIDVASSEGRVVCYYTNWSVYRPGTAKFNPQNINPYLCTHLVYAFGGFTKDNQMKPFDKYQDIEQGGYAKFTGLKTYNKQLKTMIAIGGWNEASSRFSPLVASADRRQQFIKNILKFLRQNHFDGIDLDWEYPAHREGGKSRDRDNYAQFVQELRSEFEREAEKTGRSRLLLTMAVPAGIEYIDKGYDVPKLNKYLDWFNVLTYDFHSSHEPSVNHHAPLYSLEDDSEYNYDAELNIDYSIKYYLKAGADRDKLVLGIPTYGRSYTLINEESTELGAPSEGPGEQGDATREKGYLAYYEICQTLKEDPEWTVVQPNENVMGPYAYRRNQWVGYDDEAIVRKKAEYVVAHGLGGIMFWAIDNDDFRGTCSGKPYPLIEAAKEAMLEAFGLGINEVAKSNGPQKPSRSRSRDNGITSTRNHLTSESEVNARKPSATRRPAHRGTTTTTSTTTIKLTEAKGPSLYIGGRASTTPPPPTTPDPGSDFKCEEEGFFQHPRDCKKYYWCLDSGPSGLGIVAHQFTCPSGLYFNPAADSCDFARNVPCKTQKQTTARPITSTSSTTTTTQRPTSSYNRVTAAPVARPVYPRITSTSSTTTRTTTAASAEDVLEYEEDDDDAQTSSKSTDAEEDPQVIKELIDLIRKVGGVEQLEKHLLRNKDGSITLKENVASGAPTTPSTISKSLYDRVLNRPETLGTFTRQRLNVAKIQSTESVEYSNAAVAGDGSSQTNNSKYSSVLRGNSRQGPQNEGLEKLAEFDGFLKERKPYVTINRNRGTTRDEEEAEVTSRDDDSLSEEEADSKQDPVNTTRRPIGSVTPSYTSLRRSRPTTTSTAPVESVTEPEQPIVIKEQTQTKHYATLSRTRGRSTERPQSTVSEPAIISNTNRYKYLERTQPTKSSGAIDVGADANDHDSDEDEEEYEDEPQQKKVTVPRNQSTTATSNTRKYASIGRRTKTTTITTTTPPETTTITGAETAKASTLNNYNNNNNNNNRSNTVKINNVPATTPASISIQSDITTTTTTIINETTEPVESTSTTNSHTTTTTTPTNTSPTPTPTTTPTPTPPVLSTIQTPTTSIDSLSMADGITDFLESQFTTLPPANEPSDAVHLPALDLNINNLSQVAAPTTTATVTTTESEQAKIRTTGNREQNNIDSDEDDNDNQINNVDNEVTTIKTKYATSHRRINTTNNNSKKNNAAAVNDTSPNFGNSQAFSSSDPTVNIIKSTYSGRRQPQRTQLELNTTELPVSPTNINTLGGISSPRPFGYPRRRTRPTATKPIPTITTNSTVNNYDNDSDNVNNTRHDDVAGIGKTRLSKVDRPKVSANNSQTLLDPSTNTQPTTPKSNTTNAIRTQSIVDLDVAGNGGNILRHDVVSTSTLSTKDDDQHTEIIKHTRRPTQIPAGTVRPPNSFNVKDKDSRRYAGKRLAVDYSTSSAQVNDTNGDGIEEPVTTPQTSQITTSRSYQNIARTYSRVEEKIENNTKIFDDVGLIEQTTIAEDESVSSGHGNSKIQVTNETDTASNSSGKRNYQSISRTSTRGSVDKQVPYTSIVRDSSGAHLSEDSSSSFMRNLGEVNRSEDNLPIQRGGLITETTIEDENIAAEIIDDEPPVVARGKTIAPALNDSSDDSNTATEQESREIATEGATLRKNLLTTLLSNNVEISKVTTLGADVEAGSENNNTSELASTSSEMAKTVQESTTPAVPDIESSTTTTTEQSVHTTTTAVPQNSNTSQIESLDKDVAKVKSQTSFTEKLSTKSVDPHPRRSSVQVQRTSTTETAPKTTTTTAYTASTRRSTVRSEIRTAKATTASATDAGEDEDLVINSTTPHSRRRVIVRGNYRPRKEGDLSSLLAADENKRVRYNHQQAPQQPYKDQELTDNYNTTAVPKSEDISGIADKNLTRAKLNNRASLGTVRNRTSSQTESLGNGLTRTRTTYVRTIDNGKVVKRVHTKTVQEKPAEYEYISDEVSEPVASTTARTVTRNRGSVKFRSNDLSSLLSLDFAPKGKQTKQSQPTVTKTRRRLLKKPKETIEHEEVKEFVYDDDNDVDDSELETTTRQSAVTTVRPRLRPTRPSTTISPPTIASTTPQSAVVDKKEFQRPTSKANTDQSTRTTPTRRKLTFKRPVATTIPSVSTTTTTTEEPTTSSQQPVAKQNIFRLRTSSTTTTTTNKPSTTDISDDLKDLQNNLTNELNSIQTVSNKTAIVSFTPAAEPGRETSHDDKLSLPIYHRRKYYQYVKDSPITYIDKSPEPADVESVTVNIQQQIHDVFNVSDNGKPTNSLEEDENISDDDDHRLAMEQAREINSELSHFLLKTPGSLSVETNAASDINSYRQGKTFKSKLTTAGRNETKRIIQLSILADAQQVTNDSRALRTYSRLNRKRPNLTTNPDSDDEAREVNDLETTTKSAPSLAQLFGGRRNKTTATAGQDSNTRRVNGSFNKLLSTTTPRQNLSINQRVSSENSANSAPDFDSVTYSSDEHSDENELLAELADENDVVSNEDMTTLSSSSTTGIGTAVISREHTLRSRFNTTTIGMSNTTYEESREIEQFENNVGLNIADLPSTTTVKTIGSPTPRRQILQRNRSNTDVQNITTNTGVYNDVSASKINAPDLGESTSASTETASGRPTYKRRKVIIRNRLNATKSASFTNNAGSNEAKDDEEKSRNGTEYTTPTSETKSNQNPRYQLLLRRGNTTTITTASVKQINEVNEDEDSADVINSSGDGEVIGETIELTTSRRNLLIRRRFNATAPTSKAKTSAEQNSNTEKYNAVNGTESTTLAPTTTSGRSALRRQSLVRRRYNSTTAASQNDIQEDKDNSEEISGFGNIQLTTAVPRNNRNRPTQPRDLLKQRRFNKTSTEGSAKEITTPGTDKEVDVSTRRPYATLSRTRNRFSVSRESTTTEKLISDADSDDDNDASTDDNIGDKTPDSDSLTVRGGFVQTNRHRALLRPQLSQIPATKKGEQDSQNIGRKPPNFGTRRTPAPQTKFSSSTLRSIVAVNRNLYNREDANQHENQQLDEEDDDYDNNVEDNEEDDVELEEAVDQKLSSRTSSSILGQLLASRQRIANTNTETVKTENPTKILTLIQRQHGDSTDDNDDDEDEDVDEDGDNGDNDDNEDDDVDIDNMQDNDTIEHVTENNITQPNIRNYTYQSTSYRASHNYGTSRGNSTVANYLNNSFKFSNANKNKNKNNNSTDSKNTYTNKQFEDTVGNAKNNDETKDDDSLEADIDIEETDKNNNDNENGAPERNLSDIGNDVNSKRRFQNRYQVSRTRGPTTTTTARPTASTTTAKSTTRRLSFGSRSRVQVTKISNIDDVSTEKTEESEEDDDATETTTVPTTITTATTTTATTSGKPKLKRIRVLKYRRPLQPIDSSNSTASTTNSASSTYTENTNHTITIANNTTNPIKNTPAKKFRKIVRKLRPVETTTESNKLATDEPSSEDQQTVAGETTTTTRKPFLPSHSRFGAAQHVEPGKDADEDSTDSQKQSVQPERRPVDLQRLRNRLKSQQSRGEPTDGVINSRLRGKDDKNIDEENESEGNSTLQQLRDKVKAEQARGSGEQGVINDRLKQLLVERTPLSTTTTPDNDDVELNVSSSTPASSQRPVFRRKLVAKRPYAPSAATTPTKAALVFSSTRPTAKFVRRKNGRYDPFNSNVRNRGEGFVRSDPRGARLPGADRFKQEQKEIDVDGEDADYEQQQEHPQPLINTSPLGSQVAVRRPFIPKNKQPEQDQENAKSEEEYDDDDEDEDEDNEDEDEEEEQPSKQQGQEPVSSQEQQLGDSTSKPQFHTPPAYRPKDNRVPPGNRPNFAPTASGPNANGGNVPFNPRNRQTNFSTVGSSSSAPVNRFGGSNRPRVVNRPPGVATPNLTLRPVANNYERTTPLTPLKPAPFIPSNNRSYERKYTGPSTETPEITSENPLIEDLNIDALNARNKKIFDIHSKKHTTLKPKVAAKTDAELETEVVESEDAYDQLQQRQGYVTTTPTTPTTNPTSTQSTDTTNTETETAQPQIVFHEYANEATNISSPPQDKAQATLSLTTLPPPPATTLLHVFTLVEGENEEEQEPTGRPLGSKTTAVEPKHKLIEINRIVEINSKQTKAAQRKSKANQDFGTLRVESLPHVEQLGEISVVKYVHLVDGSDIQINDGHSTVADYTPTEPSVPKNSAPVRNSLPQTEGDFELDRSGKSLLPEVIREAFETSTISLEGLFDSARKAKQLSIDTNNAVDRNADTTPLMDTDLDTINTTVPPTAASALPATYVRPIVPLLRPESNESSPLIISIANLDKVILSKVQASEGESDANAANGIEDSSTLLPPSSINAPSLAPDSNSAFSVRHASVLQAPSNQLSDLSDKHNSYAQTTFTLTNGAISGSSNNNNDSQTQTATTYTNISNISEKISYSSETHVVRRKKARRGRGRRPMKRQRNAKTTTTTATTTTVAP
ncbi:uncharacterized protein Cht6 isoform X3 [Drosophila virilis]|uniref:uncharacterized protein Cht6 isoform X3 n=1 Tax=Drosophila virilis TaxID=7244 RepID=UPI0013962BD2|nr:serine-rich adhesin for platelets isoform X3 [Drosophila virilis]